jgi:hypothetical protein
MIAMMDRLTDRQRSMVATAAQRLRERYRPAFFEHLRVHAVGVINKLKQSHALRWCVSLLCGVRGLGVCVRRPASNKQLLTRSSSKGLQRAYSGTRICLA